MTNRSSWRERRVDVLMLTTIAGWLYVYLPVISNDKTVGIASAVIGAAFLGLMLKGAC